MNARRSLIEEIANRHQDVIGAASRDGRRSSLIERRGMSRVAQVMEDHADVLYEEEHPPGCECPKCGTKFENGKMKYCSECGTKMMTASHTK